MDGWKDGWKEGWVGGKAGLRIAYSNQKRKTDNGLIVFDWGDHPSLSWQKSQNCRKEQKSLVLKK